MANNKDAIRKIKKALYLPETEAQTMLTAMQNERRKRVMLIINRKMDEPMIEDRELVAFLEGGCGGVLAPVSRSQAYRDLSVMVSIIGNIKLPSKSWLRYMIIEGAKEAYQVAKTKSDGKAMAAALDKLGKYTRADKEDDFYDWNAMLPPSFEPSDDPALLGEEVEVIENADERRRELRSIFGKGKVVQDALIIVDESA